MAGMTIEEFRVRSFCLPTYSVDSVSAPITIGGRVNVILNRAAVPICCLSFSRDGYFTALSEHAVASLPEYGFARNWRS